MSFFCSFKKFNFLFSSKQYMYDLHALLYHVQKYTTCTHVQWTSYIYTSLRLTHRSRLLVYLDKNFVDGFFFTYRIYNIFYIITFRSTWSLSFEEIQFPFLFSPVLFFGKAMYKIVVEMYLRNSMS